MIVNVVKGWVKPEFKDIFPKHMAELTPTVREDILAHLATPHMQEHLAAARPWFDRVEMKTYESTQIDLMGE